MNNHLPHDFSSQAMHPTNLGFPSPPWDPSFPLKPQKHHDKGPSWKQRHF
uniref:Uncharacterized protein n=1 Tax=Rhizophora mucronata TaxID=61149 RepID=A0A2P2R180_RHIMU